MALLTERWMVERCHQGVDQQREENRLIEHRKMEHSTPKVEWKVEFLVDYVDTQEAGSVHQFHRSKDPMQRGSQQRQEHCEHH